MYLYITKNDSINDAMVFCMDHSDNSVQLACLISDSLCAEDGHRDKFLARLYLISDLLHNSTLASATHSYWTFRRYFELLLPSALEKAFRWLSSSLPASERLPLTNSVTALLDVL